MKSRIKQFIILSCTILLAGINSCKEPPVEPEPGGITVENQGAHLACFSQNGKPLLAFGPNLEHMLFEDYDYRHWADWAAEHGMNHCRTRLFGSRTQNNSLTDFKYPRRILSSSKEATLYIASQPGEGDVRFNSRTVKLINTNLEDGNDSFDIWKPSAPGGKIDSFSDEVTNGTYELDLPDFFNDIAVHIYK